MDNQCFYAVYYQKLIKTARDCGYALAIHGSMSRDFDLIAMPWTVEAVSDDELLTAFKKNHGLEPNHEGKVKKLHNRIAVTLQISGGDVFADLSILPREEVIKKVEECDCWQMTEKGAPAPECTYCKGKGIIQGTVEGDICNRDGCNGVLAYPPVENCSCHIDPPCGQCIGNLLTCPVCEWEEEPA